MTIGRFAPGKKYGVKRIADREPPMRLKEACEIMN